MPRLREQERPAEPGDYRLTPLLVGMDQGGDVMGMQAPGDAGPSGMVAAP